MRCVQDITVCGLLVGSSLVVAATACSRSPNDASTSSVLHANAFAGPAPNVSFDQVIEGSAQRMLKEGRQIFVESIMDPYDALAPVTTSSNKGADPERHARHVGIESNHSVNVRSGAKQSSTIVLDHSRVARCAGPRRYGFASTHHLIQPWRKHLTSSVSAVASPERRSRWASRTAG
jgi:hypothetical protein